MELLVIGGTGTIGALLVEVLRRRGHAVRVAGRSTGFDLTRPSKWAAAFDGVRRCFYLSPRTVPRQAEVGASASPHVEAVLGRSAISVETFARDHAARWTREVA